MNRPLEDKSLPADAQSDRKIALQAPLFVLLDKVLYFAHHIVDILVREIVPVFRVPENLLSDTGTNLLSHLMTDVCKALG